METRKAVEIFRKEGNRRRLHRQIGFTEQTDEEAMRELAEALDLNLEFDIHGELFWEFRLDIPTISKEEADQIWEGWIAKVDAAERVTNEIKNQTKDPAPQKTLRKDRVHTTNNNKPTISNPKKSDEVIEPKQKKGISLHSVLAAVGFLLFLIFTFGEAGFLGFIGIN